MQVVLPVLALCTFASLALGCGAVFPRYTTAYRPVPEDLRASGRLTRPSPGVQQITFREAEVSPHRENGSGWDPDSPPDLYAVLYRDDTEVYRTPVILDGVHPIWNNASVTLEVTSASRLRIELWDEDGPFDDIVGRQDFIGIPEDARGGGEWLVSLQGGASLMLSVSPPAPRLGLGVTYGLHDSYLGVLAVVTESPAARAGLRVGDHITAVNHHPVTDLGELGAREAMDRGAVMPLDLTVVRGSAPAVELNTRVDAAYPAQ